MKLEDDLGSWPEPPQTSRMESFKTIFYIQKRHELKILFIYYELFALQKIV